MAVYGGGGFAGEGALAVYRSEETGQRFSGIWGAECVAIPQ